MFFLGGKCLKHEGDKERAGLTRRGDGTTARSIGAGVDWRERRCYVPK